MKILARLKRHPFSVSAFFRHSLVLTLPLPNFLRFLILLGLAAAGLWLVLSLAVSHYVYDRSGLYQADWLGQIFPRPPSRYANLHAGFDEFSGILRARFPRSHATVLDFFDPKEMSEPSIERARRAQTTRATSADIRALPFADEELDAAFLIFAAHELRQPKSRVQLFRELHRALKPSGRLVLVEHLRDLPNFLAFGPGFLHFHSRATWLHDISGAALIVKREFSLNPFVRVLVLAPPALPGAIED